MEPTPARFEELAAYNAQMHRTRRTPIGGGIERLDTYPPPLVFSPDYQARMAAVQVEHTEWLRAALTRDAEETGKVVTQMPGGGFLIVPKGLQLPRLGWRERIRGRLFARKLKRMMR